MSFESPGCSPSSPSSSSSYVVHLSILDGVRKKWVSSAAYHKAGESLVLTQMFSLSAIGEITGQEVISWLSWAALWEE